MLGWEFIRLCEIVEQVNTDDICLGIFLRLSNLANFNHRVHIGVEEK